MLGFLLFQPPGLFLAFNFLEKAGFNVWYDGRIDYGTSWEQVIFKAIDDCAAFIVVMTPQSWESDWVLRECQYADKRKKPQFPLLLDDEEFPFYVDNQYADVRGGKLPLKDFVTRLSQVIEPQTQSGKRYAAWNDHLSTCETKF